MSEPSEILLWIDRAEEDYILAKLSLKQLKPLVYGASFHVQQCIEKYLKALLLSQNQPFPKTHDLVALSDLCERAGIILPIGEEDLQKLEAYSVEVRYPGQLPDLEITRWAFQMAGQMRRFSRKKLGLSAK